MSLSVKSNTFVPFYGKDGDTLKLRTTHISVPLEKQGNHFVSYFLPTSLCNVTLSFPLTVHLPKLFVKRWDDTVDEFSSQLLSWTFVTLSTNRLLSSGCDVREPGDSSDSLRLSLLSFGERVSSLTCNFPSLKPFSILRSVLVRSFHVPTPRRGYRQGPHASPFRKSGSDSKNVDTYPSLYTGPSLFTRVQGSSGYYSRKVSGKQLLDHY